MRFSEFFRGSRLLGKRGIWAGKLRSEREGRTVEPCRAPNLLGVSKNSILPAKQYVNTVASARMLDELSHEFEEPAARRVAGQGPLRFLSQRNRLADAERGRNCNNEGMDPLAGR